MNSMVSKKEGISFSILIWTKCPSNVAADLLSFMCISSSFAPVHLHVYFCTVQILELSNFSELICRRRCILSLDGNVEARFVDHPFFEKKKKLKLLRIFRSSVDIENICCQILVSLKVFAIGIQFICLQHVFRVGFEAILFELDMSFI